MNEKKLLESLLKGIEPTIDILPREYTHEKDISEVEGSPIDWMNLCDIKYRWWRYHNEEYVRELLKMEGGVIKFNPSVVEDYLNKLK